MVEEGPPLDGRTRRARERGAASRRLDAARVVAGFGQGADEPPGTGADVEHARAMRESGAAEEAHRLARDRALEDGHRPGQPWLGEAVLPGLVRLRRGRVACSRGSAARGAAIEFVGALIGRLAAAHDEHGLRYTICRPFNAYGPGEMPEDEPGIAHMVPDVIRKVLSGQRPLQIFGSGQQTRTLTYVDDIAKGIVTAMDSQAGLNEDFNISAGEEMTVAEIARIIWEECGEDPGAFELEHVGSFEVDVQRRWPDVSKAERLLGWKAMLDLDRMCEDAWRWQSQAAGLKR